MNCLVNMFAALRQVQLTLQNDKQAMGSHAESPEVWRLVL
ncbi:hypothetical protein DOT_3682 [Desulfosporosinus sp. OT]|nr:hypothetical protein DOT_3682 [Desulfosporosinus sp. OT]